MTSPLREAQLRKLSDGVFDLLVVGGGASGSGIALDAAARGLKVALIEKNDFASGTSSKSTKLIHGGVRYLEQAVLQFDRSQFKLVREALRERSTLLRIAPHLAQPLPILTPIYRRIEVPYYRTGLKLYDRLAGSQKLHSSFFISAKEALSKFPQLRKENLRGAVVYFDGQFDDARMNVCIVLRALELGATVCNYIEVQDFLKQASRISGVIAYDRRRGHSFEIKGKVVVNAAGPYLDHLRFLENPTQPALLKVSKGSHIVLPKEFSPSSTGLLIPKTDDKRVLFCLPWQNHTLVGTTDEAALPQEGLQPTSNEIEFMVGQLQKYFVFPVTPEQVLSAWTGLRPLFAFAQPRGQKTSRISRDHHLERGASDLITIAGGKWTTYRKMAEDTVNFVLEQFPSLKARTSCQTDSIFVSGSSPDFLRFKKTFMQINSLPADIKEHLLNCYGEHASEVIQSKYGDCARLDARWPFLVNEVRYGFEKEFVETAEDYLFRRVRLGFLNDAETKRLLPVVGRLLEACYLRSETSY